MGAGIAGPFKLLLQDARGTRVYAFELGRVEGLAGLDVGGKLVLRGCEVARGVVLLDSRVCVVLGGKIEALSEAWKKGRKERLKVAVVAGAGE